MSDTLLAAVSGGLGFVAGAFVTLMVVASVLRQAERSDE